MGATLFLNWGTVSLPCSVYEAESPSSCGVKRQDQTIGRLNKAVGACPRCYCVSLLKTPCLLAWVWASWLARHYTHTLWRRVVDDSLVVGWVIAARIGGRRRSNEPDQDYGTFQEATRHSESPEAGRVLHSIHRVADATMKRHKSLPMLSEQPLIVT